MANRRFSPTSSLKDTILLYFTHPKLIYVGFLYLHAQIYQYDQTQSV